MADLNTKTFTQLVQGQAAQIQARASVLVNFALGALFRAWTEAVAAVVLWLQSLILTVLMFSRASTSSGADLDSWIADFGGPFVVNGEVQFARIPSVPSSGLVTFSRFTTGTQALIAVGAAVETQDGALRFAVVKDAENVAWSETDQAYVMSPGQDEVFVPVVNLLAVGDAFGSRGNVLAGAINTIVSTLPGVDLVTNEDDFANGVDAETDEALRIRFRGFIQALADGTPTAIIYWVKSLGAKVSATIVEYQEIDGTPKAAYFYAVVDDGRDVVDPTFLATATAVIDAHRAAGVEFDAYLRTLVPVDVSFTITTALAADEDDAGALAVAAVRAYLNSLALGETMVFNRLFSVIYGASSLIIDVDDLQANGDDVSIVAAPVERIVAGTVAAL